MKPEPFYECPGDVSHHRTGDRLPFGLPCTAAEGSVVGNGISVGIGTPPLPIKTAHTEEPAFLWGCTDERPAGRGGHGSQQHRAPHRSGCTARRHGASDHCRAPVRRPSGPCRQPRCRAPGRRTPVFVQRLGQLVLADSRSLTERTDRGRQPCQRHFGGTGCPPRPQPRSTTYPCSRPPSTDRGCSRGRGLRRRCVGRPRRTTADPLVFYDRFGSVVDAGKAVRAAAAAAERLESSALPRASASALLRPSASPTSLPLRYTTCWIL